MADKRPIGDRIIGWYGDVAARNLASHGSFVHHWLMMGYKLMTEKSAYLPDKKLHRSSQQAYAIFMRSIVGAMDDPRHAALTSIFCPTEPLRAMGIKPMCAEAVASFASGAQAEGAFVAAAEGAGVPQTYCSYHKVLLGLAESGMLDPVPLLASSSVACDANNLTFKTLAGKWQVPHVYLDVPYDISRESCLFVADEIREMTRTAEEVFGATLDEEKLAGLCQAEAAEDHELWHALTTYPGRYLANTMTVDMMRMLDLHLMAGNPEVRSMVEQLHQDLAQAPAYHGLNIVWAHTSPYFLGSIGQYLDCSDTAQIVASDMTFDHLDVEFDPWFGPEHPYEYLAERLVRNCFNGPSARRAETLKRLARDTHADGVVIFCHWGCRQTAGASQFMRHELEDAGFPTLILDGDCVDRQNCAPGQMTTRFSAFLEMLERRKEGEAS